MGRLLRSLLEWLQRRCPHERVTFDIMEGEFKDRAISWCQHCGAYQIQLVEEMNVKRFGEIREPHARW